jgi:uncharacterized membrane protein YedE/YeeE
MERRPVLHWLPAGLLLGGVFLFAIAAVQPLGVSTQYVRAVGGLCELAAPATATANPYFQSEKLVFGYGEMLVLGIPIGALVASTLARRRTLQAVPDPWFIRFGPSWTKRFLAAFAGGFLLLFGARLAGGCTSGHILSGVSQLAVSSILFMVATFGTAVLAARSLYPVSPAGAGHHPRTGTEGGSP